MEEGGRHRGKDGESQVICTDQCFIRWQRGLHYVHVSHDVVHDVNLAQVHFILALMDIDKTLLLRHLHHQGAAEWIRLLGMICSTSSALSGWTDVPSAGSYLGIPQSSWLNKSTVL
jgi:hypothetical protein